MHVCTAIHFCRVDAHYLFIFNIIIKVLKQELVPYKIQFGKCIMFVILVSANVVKGNVDKEIIFVYTNYIFDLKIV